RWLGELNGPPHSRGPWPHITLERGFWRVAPTADFFRQPHIDRLEGEALAWVGELIVQARGGLPDGMMLSPFASAVPGLLLVSPSAAGPALDRLRDWTALRALEISDHEPSYAALDRLAHFPQPIQELRLHGGHYGPPDAGCLDGGAAFADVSRFAMCHARV